MTAAALSTTGRSLRRSPVIAKTNDITSCANQNPCIARLAHCAPQAAEIVRILNTKQLGASIADAGASGSGGGGASLTGAEVMRSLVTALQILLFCGALGLNCGVLALRNKADNARRLPGRDGRTAAGVALPTSACGQTTEATTRATCAHLRNQHQRALRMANCAGRNC